MGVSTQSTWGPANNTNFTLITRSISFITHIPQIRVFVTIMSKSFQAKVKVLPNVRKANDSSSTMQRARRIAMLILALCVTDVHSSQANPGKMETAPGLPKGFRRLSEPSCPCPGTKHKLEWHVTKLPKWGCDMCQQRFPKGTRMYGCLECNWDACRRCYDDKMETVPWGVGGFQRLSEPPSKTMSRFMSSPCPGIEHELLWSDAPSPFTCDICKKIIAKPAKYTMMYGCRECDWHTCTSCYKKYKYRLCFEKLPRPDRLAAKYRTFD